jgi:formylglycine-generating enzyme required for sulfatase activity
VNLNGGVKLEMVEIPAGSFCMGSTKEVPSTPVHEVQIKDAFYIGKFEVTQAEWQQVMGNNPSYHKGDRLPVTHESWVDAQSFINKLNERGDGFKYRLPTEAEWEYACRAGTTGDFAGNLNELAWHGESFGKPHPVGEKRPNAFGLYDMHGNVWEWCEDWLHETYKGAPTDGSAWLKGGDQSLRVVRGGSSRFGPVILTSAHRRSLPNDSSEDDIGFRVVAMPRTR